MMRTWETRSLPGECDPPADLAPVECLYCGSSSCVAWECLDTDAEAAMFVGEADE